MGCLLINKYCSFDEIRDKREEKTTGLRWRLICSRVRDCAQCVLTKHENLPNTNMFLWRDPATEMV